MNIDEIKELIRVVQETGIRVLEVQDGDHRIRVEGTAANQDIITHAITPVIAAQAQPIMAAAPAPELAAPVASREDEHDVTVKSPIVGTYYDAPSPGAAPFVKIGDRVEPKQVLCIIESMKLMNEIEAEMAGTVIAKHVENGRPVEYGESLLTVRPV